MFQLACTFILGVIELTREGMMEQDHVRRWPLFMHLKGSASTTVSEYAGSTEKGKLGL